MNLVLPSDDGLAYTQKRHDCLAYFDRWSMAAVLCVRRVITKINLGPMAVVNVAVVVKGRR